MADNAPILVPKSLHRRIKTEASRLGISLKKIAITMAESWLALPDKKKRQISTNP